MDRPYRDECRRCNTPATRNQASALNGRCSQRIAPEQAQNGDFSGVHKLLAVLKRPFDEQPDNAAYAELPPDWAAHLEVSCSS